MAGRKVNGYNTAVVNFTKEELRAVKKKACEQVASALSFFDVKQDLIKKIGQCDLKALHKARKQVGGEGYYPDFDEKAAEILTNRKSPEGTPSVQVAEEEGYGLPEYSAYYGPDVRGWSGRWGSTKGSPDDICWAFIADEAKCRTVADFVDTQLEEARRQGKERSVIVWKD